MWAIDSDNLAIQYFRVTSIRANDDSNGGFTITAVQHDPNKYRYIDDGVRITPAPVTVTPVSVLPAPKNIILTETDHIEQGLTVATMNASWDRVDGAIRYQAQWRKDNGDWINVPVSSAQGFSVQGIYSGSYDVRVRALNAQESSSPWGYADTTHLTGKAGRPGTPENLLASDNVIWNIDLTWSFPDGSGDTAYTEIQRSTTDDKANPLLLALVPYPATHYQHGPMRAGVSQWYRARLVDRIGNQSDWTYWVRGMSSDQASDYLDAIKDEVLSAEDGKALTEQIDFNIAGILQNTLSGIQGAKITFQQFGSAYAEISNEQILIADANQAFAQFQELVAVQFADNAAEIYEVKTAQATADKAFAEYQLTVAADFRGVNSSITTIQQAQASADQAFAQYQQQVTAKFSDQQSAINEKMTAYADATSANAIYTLKAGVKYNGNYYDAGISVAVIANGNAISTRVAINANEFVMLSGNGTANMYSPFAIVGGQVFLNSAFIQDGTITSAMIAGYIQSNNYVSGSVGWRLDKGGVFENNGSVAGQGSMRQTNQKISVKDSNGVLRVQIGYLDGVF